MKIPITCFLTISLSMFSSVVLGALVGTNTTLLTNLQPGTNPESASTIDLTSGAATASGTSNVGGITLGDGTISEFLFTNGAGVNDAVAGAANVFSSSSSAIITTPQFAAGTVSADGPTFATITEPDGVTTFSSDTHIRSSDVTFSVDTSNFESGSVYVVFGTFQDFAQVSVTDGVTDEISGLLGIQDTNAAFDTTGTAFDFSGTSLAGTGTAIAEFQFDNLVDGFANTTLDFRQINTDLDGSRARFYGIVVDGVLIPEPTTLGVLGSIFALLLFFQRRRRAV